MKRINVTETFLPPKEEYQAIIEGLWESKWLTNRGQLVLSLESSLHDYLGSTSKPLLVNNGTVAIQLPLKALQLSGEIITTPFSYVATTSTVVWENCTPVFVDIDPEHLSIDEKKIEAAITNKTTAILAVHVFGNPCAVEKIEEIAKKHDLRVIYDAAHCFGVNYKGKSVFDYGDVSTTSFHATKLFHTGEGGAIFCNDNSAKDVIFYHHNFGHDGPEAFHGLGINAKMNELNAGMGIALLPYMDHVIQERKKVSEHYDEAINWKNVRKPLLRPETDYNYAYYPVIFDSEEHLLEAQRKMNEHHIFPRRYFYPALNTLPYLDYSEMPIAENIAKCILCLPLYVGLNNDEITLISNFVN